MINDDFLSTLASDIEQTDRQIQKKHINRCTDKEGESGKEGYGMADWY